jgi:hypothetical protein
MSVKIEVNDPSKAPGVLMVAAFFGVLLGGLASGCLPEGNIPVGQHILGDRTVEGVSFIPAQAASPARLILQGPARAVRVVFSDMLNSGFYATYFVSDLYLLGETDSPTGPSPRISDRARVIANNTLKLIDCAGARSCSAIRVDALGRILVNELMSDGTDVSALVRIDLATGERTQLLVTNTGRGSNIEFSPGRLRIALGTSGDTPGTRIREIDDQETTLDTYGQFVGEDFFYIQGGTLKRLLPHGLSEDVSLEVLSFSVLVGPPHPVLYIDHGTYTSQGPVMTHLPSSFLDLDTLQEESIPQELKGLVPTLSPDRTKALFAPFNGVPSDTTKLSLLDRDRGELETIGIPGSVQSTYWRPDADEVWISFTPTVDAATFEPSRFDTQTMIWRVGVDLLQVPIWPVIPLQPGFGVTPYGRLTSTSFSTFTPDGRFWFSYSIPPEGGQRVEVRRADDPLTPGPSLHPQGTTPSMELRLDDGRYLTEGEFRDYNRADIAIVDPETGLSQPLANGGHVIAAGQKRALALLKWIASANSGDLTLIDYATGRQTVLAENVFAASLERDTSGQSSNDDPLGPGGRVAFLVRNRFASPYDGLWITTLP